MFAEHSYVGIIVPLVHGILVPCACAWYNIMVETMKMQFLAYFDSLFYYFNVFKKI